MKNKFEKSLSGISQSAIFEFIRLQFFYADKSSELCPRKKICVMRGKIKLLVMALAVMSCSKEDMNSLNGIDYEYGRELSHDRIVLGNRLENPYKTENVTKALQDLYPSKAGRVEVEPTDYYVRFLPSDKAECDYLESLGLELVDHPLDYEIAVDGDWYHDPEVPDGNVTWQYAVVPVGFDFPEHIEYEIIHECHIINPSESTKADGIDWSAVERKAFINTGNEDRLDELATKSGSGKVVPCGRITIVDEHASGAKPFGVAGVRVSCNTFVKFDRTYTDRDGYYRMNKAFSSKLRYRLVFSNQKGFSIGLNLVLVPASVSTLGKASPAGVNMTVTDRSDGKLFRRCVVNNAAYDYYSRCSKDDMNIALPPADLRIWILNGMKASSAVMLHHDAALTNAQISSFLGKFAPLVKFLLPDITLGTGGKDDYRSIYSATCHELSHASHFAKVGTEYWNKYIRYIVESYITSGGMTYGEGTGTGAGHCQIGEEWAYFLESRMFKDRYGGTFPTFGTSYWFNPQIFRYLNERGLSVAQMFAVLDKNVSSRKDLKEAILTAYPSRKNLVEQVFNRY